MDFVFFVLPNLLKTVDAVSPSAAVNRKKKRMRKKHDVRTSLQNNKKVEEKTNPRTNMKAASKKDLKEFKNT